MAFPTERTAKAGDEELRKASGWPLSSGKPPWPTVEDFLPAHYRIEALRAASRVWSDKTNPHLDDVAANTIHIAEQFALWLEDGKR